ncbi:MAG: rhodanese-related sulfurtransferase [Patescibacteria group bacterium]
MQKIILYYKFTPVTDPTMTMHWQRELCTRLNLRGRIIISEHGINGTLGGDIEDLKAYKRAMNETDAFKGIEYKWSSGEREDFPKLSIKVRDELVTLAPGEEFDVFNKSRGLRPDAWHKYMEENPDVIVLDARNEYESDIGVFKSKNLVAPKIKTFKDIKPYLDKLPRDQPILTYCTGDIRCEYLSAYMQHIGFDEVYHLDGGIVKYGEKYKDDGFWDGKCYVFDKRMNLAFSDQANDLGQCIDCDKHSSNQVNCDDCNKQIVVCTACEDEYIHCTNPTMRSSLRRKTEV